MSAESEDRAKINQLHVRLNDAWTRISNLEKTCEELQEELLNAYMQIHALEAGEVPAPKDEKAQEQHL